MTARRRWPVLARRSTLSRSQWQAGGILPTNSQSPQPAKPLRPLRSHRPPRHGRRRRHLAGTWRRHQRGFACVILSSPGLGSATSRLNLGLDHSRSAGQENTVLSCARRMHIRRSGKRASLLATGPFSPRPFRRPRTPVHHLVHHDDGETSRFTDHSALVRISRPPRSPFAETDLCCRRRRRWYQQRAVPPFHYVRTSCRSRRETAKGRGARFDHDGAVHQLHPSALLLMVAAGQPANWRFVRALTVRPRPVRRWPLSSQHRPTRTRPDA